MASGTGELATAFFFIAVLYAAVGQAGASGYIAVMGLAGLGPVVMKTTALALNLVVAAIGTAVFVRAGKVSWRNVWPFAALGFPFSMLGGAVHLSERVYFPVVGIVLILSGVQMARSAFRERLPDSDEPVTPPFRAALATGAVTASSLGRRERGVVSFWLL